MEYKLLKDWESKRHNKKLIAGIIVRITKQKELEELIELGCIETPKKIEKNNKKINKIINLKNKENGNIKRN
tara:strand:- start:111 stop:326 length:216 start_codon:yes stop_codon:yes gene_type:complete